MILSGMDTQALLEVPSRRGLHMGEKPLDVTTAGVCACAGSASSRLKADPAFKSLGRDNSGKSANKGFRGNPSPGQRAGGYPVDQCEAWEQAQPGGGRRA